MKGPHWTEISARKAGKPNEFGKVMKIQESENQIVVDSSHCMSNPTGIIPTGPRLDFSAPTRRSMPRS
jgi:glutathionyl-hydroquinone reductase